MGIYGYLSLSGVVIIAIFFIKYAIKKNREIRILKKSINSQNKIMESYKEYLNKIDKLDEWRENVREKIDENTDIALLDIINANNKLYDNSNAEDNNTTETK